MQHRPTRGLHRIGSVVKVPVQLVKAKQLIAVLGKGRCCIRKTKASSMHGF